MSAGFEVRGYCFAQLISNGHSDMSYRVCGCDCSGHIPSLHGHLKSQLAPVYPVERVCRGLFEMAGYNAVLIGQLHTGLSFTSSVHFPLF